jgi:fucose permease
VSPQRSSRSVLIALAFIGFVSLGLPDGLLGVASPSIRATFALAPEDIGSLLLSFAGGYLVSSFASGAILARVGVGTLLAASCFLTAASLLVYAATPWWWIMVAAGCVSGAGAGAIDAGLNTYAATNHSPRTMNWLHGCYGVGAMSGPLVMTAVLAAGEPWQRGYALVGVAQLVLAAAFAATRRRWPSPRGSAPEGGGGGPIAAARTLGTLARPLVWLGIAIFVLYTGLEATIAVWAFSLLTEARGVPATTAGLAASAFWLGLTAGRFLFGSLAGRIAVATLLRACLGAIGAGAALVWLDASDALSVAGLVVCGFAMAPVFPSLIATTPARLGDAHAANAVGFQIAAAAIGAALLPTLAGVLAGRFGLEAIPPALVLGGVLLLALHEVLDASDRRAGDATTLR